MNEEPLSTSIHQAQFVIFVKPLWYREIVGFFFTELKRFKCEFQHNDRLYHAVRGLLLISLERAEEATRKVTKKNTTDHLEADLHVEQSVCGQRQELVSSAILIREDEEHGRGEAVHLSPNLDDHCALDIKSKFEEIPTRQVIYQCPLCEKSFSERHDLLYHTATHDEPVREPSASDVDIGAVVDGQEVDPHHSETELVASRGSVVKVEIAPDLPSADHIMNNPVGSSPEGEVAKESLLVYNGVSHRGAGEILVRVQSGSHNDGISSHSNTSNQQSVNENPDSEREKNEVRTDGASGENGNKFPCSHCGKSYAKRCRLEVHMTLHGPENSDILCPDCGRCFTHKNLLTAHIYKIHRPPPPCGICNKHFASRSSRVRHMQAAHFVGGKAKAVDTACGCEICGRVYPNRMKLNYHRSKHRNNEIPGVCEICGKTIKRRDAMKLHMDLHQPHGDFGCDVCPRTFHTMRHLSKHQKVHLKGKPVVPHVVCEVCGKTVYKYRLKQHMRDHDASPTGYRCDLCPKVFTRLHLLQQHCTRHIQQAYLQCQTCGKHFMTKKGLKAHEMQHAGDLPFQCEQCGKAFPTLGMRNTHTRAKHSSDRRRQYMCSYCPKAFLMRKTLDDHINTHTGRRPYVCEECGDTFANCGALHTHRKLKHGRHHGKTGFGTECGKRLV